MKTDTLPKTRIKPSSFHQTKLSTAAIATIAVELCKLSDDERSRFPSRLRLVFDELSKYESIVIQSNVQTEPSEAPSPHPQIAAGALFIPYTFRDVFNLLRYISDDASASGSA